MRKLWNKMDCYLAVRVSKRLLYGGLLPLLSGSLFEAMGRPAVAGLLLALAVCMMAGSIALCHARAVCPHCSAYLGDDIRIITSVPSYCPHCGEKL